MAQELLVVHVQVHVKPEGLETFRHATLANAEASRKEPGVVRFDVAQDRDDPTRWVLVEVYRDAAASAAHKETAHYAAWRDAVAPLMADPRTSRKFSSVSPDAAGWRS
jgi:quinol monooxygenase YgiN